MKLCPQCDTGYADSHVTCPTHGVMLGEIRELRPGMLIRNTYRVIRKLGQGGMGAVYLCEHTLMKEQQALKFLSSDLSQDEAFASRFLREVRTLRQIRHKNVVDAGNLEPAEDGTLFFSMEFVDGPDLREFLRTVPRPLDVHQALLIARGIAEGLGAAHAQGMVHRDIKPDNILMAVTEHGWTPKIADFGIVATRENSSLRTRTGGTLLTMPYAAPEQWRGMKAADLDGRTDLYAFGGVLFEMLTGETVFDAESYEGWAEHHRYSAPRPPSSVRPELEDWNGLDALVQELLAKDRDQRPKDVAEVLSRMDAIRYVDPRLRTVTERIEKRTETVAEEFARPRFENGTGIQSLFGGGSLPELKTRQVEEAPASRLQVAPGVVEADLAASPKSVGAPISRMGIWIGAGGVAALVLGIVVWATVGRGTRTPAAPPPEALPSQTQAQTQAANEQPATDAPKPSKVAKPGTAANGIAANRPAAAPATSTVPAVKTLPDNATNPARTAVWPGAAPANAGASSVNPPAPTAASKRSIAIASGVAQGMLVQRVSPIYPPIAKAAGVSGTVVLHATISKAGTIEDLSVVSGNAMLIQAATDAVKLWRYQPYMLNGEPVEVDTTINVVFNLGPGAPNAAPPQAPSSN